MTWQAGAKCKGADETFVPDHTDPKVMRPLAEQYCSGCSVRQECGQLADAIRATGLWGGVFRYRAGGTGDYQWEPLTVGAHIPVKGRRRPGTAARCAA
jgi:hypothetical protein